MVWRSILHGESTYNKEDKMIVFKELYSQAKIGKDMDRALEHLEMDEATKLYDALELVRNYTGIDMRQEYLLVCLRYKIDTEGR
jgi:hypothetical protein